MRGSFKPFFLGILFTSILWGCVLYYYITLYPTNSATFKHSEPFLKFPSNPHYSSVIEKDKNTTDSVHTSSSSLVNTSKRKSIQNQLETNLGLVRNSVDKKIREDGYSQHAFNVLVSSRLDNHREIPDSRHKL